MSCIGVHINRLENIGVGAFRVDAMQVNVSVVCGIDSGNYLLVTPHHIWVTDWESKIVDVKSNTDWKVD